MNRSFLNLFSLTVILSLVFVVTGCASNDNESNASSNEESSQDTLIYARGADANGLDPSTVTDGESFKVTQQVYETLLQFEPGTTDVEPRLATGWEESDDGKTYTFTLQEDVKFHDGTDFNAEAVVTNFEHWIENEEGDVAYYPSMFGGFEEDSVIKNVEAIDEYTVEFSLDEPYSPFLENMAFPAFGIASPDAIEEGSLNESPVGTGPFTFEKWDKDNTIEVTKNEDYWNEGYPKLNSLIFQVISDNSSRLNALKNNEIDMMDGLNLSDVESLEDDKDIDIWERESLNHAELIFNVEDEPFDDKKVRQALSHAVEKEAIIDSLFSGYAEPMDNQIQKPIEDFNDINDYDYDLDKAKDMLEDAGYSDGFEMDLWVMSNPRPYLPQSQKVAEAIQSSFEEIGLEVNIEPVEWSTYIDKVNEGEPSIFLMGGTSDNANAANFLNTNYGKDSIGSLNYSRYNNDDFEELTKQGIKEIDDSKQEKLVKEALEILHEDTPTVPIASAEEPIIGSPSIQDYTPNPAGQDILDEVYFK